MAMIMHERERRGGPVAAPSSAWASAVHPASQTEAVDTCLLAAASGGAVTAVAVCTAAVAAEQAFASAAFAAVLEAGLSTLPPGAAACTAAVAAGLAFASAGAFAAAVLAWASVPPPGSCTSAAAFAAAVEAATVADGRSAGTTVRCQSRGRTSPAGSAADLDPPRTVPVAPNKQIVQHTEVNDEVKDDLKPYFGD